MPDKQNKIVPINYTNREFSSIKEDLIEIAERFYPDTFRDFSEASFGSLLLDSVAYVGDQLSFYLDYNVNESFLDTAYQFKNVVRHGRILGYKYSGRASTYGKVALYVQVPASQTGLGPDLAAIPILKRGTRFASQNGLNFVLTENVDFSKSNNPIVVSQTDSTTGAPTYFAIKTYGDVVSGYFGTDVVECGAYERFKRVKLKASNVSEILSVHDEQGHEYFEVDYLSQDMVFKEIVNANYKNDNTPSILKPYLVSRKFIVVQERNSVYLQFGSGKSGQSNVVAEPQQVTMDAFGKTYVTDRTFDPTRLSQNESFGIVPSNTRLTVVYRATNPTNSNVAVGGLNMVVNSSFEFEGREYITNSTMEFVKNSLEISNEEPITGDTSAANTSELKQRIYDTFPTQNRAVTQADYESIVYRMPGKFGSIKRCSVQRDPNSERRNLNMYVISEDNFGKLTKTNDTVKKNLKTWINHYRMINDTIDIVDPYIIDLGIHFTAKIASGANKFSVLDMAMDSLKEHYSGGYYIGESFYISDIYKVLKDVEGILDVTKVKVINKSGIGYSSATLDINDNLSPDGSHLVVPKNAIVQIKYPQTDIVGKLV